MTRPITVEIAVAIIPTESETRTVDNVDENVTTKGVGAKRVLCTRSHQRRLGHGG